MNKINIFKNLAWKIKYEAWDMPYPPVLFWKKDLYLKDIINWRKESIKIQDVNHKMWLYVHIPFCYTRCFFCTCTTTVEHNIKKYDKYLDLIEKECKILSKTFIKVMFNTVYVWWGTPTIMTAEQIDRFYNILKKYFNLSQVEQIMTEWSPYTTNEEKIKIIAKHGINKMTFWVQSLDSNTLKSNNRFQQFDDVKNAINLARKYWIEYINLDIMAWLPGQDMNWFKETINLIETLNPTTVHVNSFWPTKTTNYTIMWWKYSQDNINLRNEMEKYWKYLEDKESKITDTKKQNLQLYNAHNQNSSILWLWYWAISHAFWKVHYCKNSFQDYEEMLNWKLIPLNWYELTIEDEIITYLINNLRGWLYIDKINTLFKIDLKSTEIYNNKLAKMIEKNIVIETSDDYWKLLRFRLNSDVFCSIYSKYLYSEEIIQEFEEIMPLNKYEYIDTDFKLKTFFTD